MKYLLYLLFTATSLAQAVLVPSDAGIVRAHNRSGALKGYLGDAQQKQPVKNMLFETSDKEEAPDDNETDFPAII